MNEITEGYRPSPQQARLWPSHEAGHLAPWQCRVRLDGRFDSARWRAAAEAVVARHAALRTVFRRTPGMRLPLQVVQPLPAIDWTEHAAADGDLDALAESSRQADADPSAEQMRVRIIRVAADRIEALITVPALVADFASLDVIVADIAAFYDGRGDRLASPLDYPQYAEWRNERSQASGPADGIAEASAPSAPIPFHRHAASSNHRARAAVARRRAWIDTAVLQRVAFSCDAPVDHLLFAAWAVVLGRLTGVSTFVAPYVDAGRDDEVLADAVGPYAAPIGVRCDLERHLTFRRWLTGIRATIEDVSASSSSLAAGADIASAAAELSTAFTVSSTGTAIDTESLRFVAGGKWGPLSARVEMRAVIGAEHLQLELWYDGDALLPEDAATILEAYDTVLASAVGDPEQTLHTLQIVDAGALRELSARGTGPVRTTPALAVLRRFERHARVSPDRVAIVSSNGSVTYGALDAAATRLAGRLRASGVAPQDPVAVCLDRGAEALIAMLAVWKAGAIYVPIEVRGPANRTREALAEIGATAVITTREVGTVWDFAPVLTPVYVDEGTDGPAPRILQHRWDDDALAYILFTSGSTGAPKPVGVSHAALANYADAIVNAVAITKDDGSPSTWGLVSTLCADLGYTSVCGALASGGALLIVSIENSRDAAAFRQAMVAGRPDVVKITPSHLGALLAADRSAALLPAHTLVLGGEPLPAALVSDVASLAPCAVTNHYGPTETTIGSLICPEVHRRDDLANGVPVGRPLTNTRCLVVDAALNPLPAGVEGELCIAGAGVARGYIGMPAATAARFVPDLTSAGGRMYRSGDRATLRRDGTIEVLGRRDHQLKIRGYRVELGEIEAALARHPSVRQCVVVYRQSVHGTGSLVAYVVFHAGQRVDATTLRAHAHDWLPEYATPHAFVAMAALPLTPNGKVDRAALPEPSDEASQAERQAPATEAERVLAAVWEDVLRVASVGVDDDFFELGGDSILSLQIVARAAQRGIRVTPQQIFDCATIGALAAVAERIRPPAAPAAAAPSGVLPLTPAQQWFFERGVQDPDHWSMATLLALTTPLAPEAMEQAIQSVYLHHDALRLRFHTSERGWQQEYGPAHVLRLPVHDLRDAGDAWDTAIAEHARRLQRTLSLDGPLVAAALFELPGALGRRLLIVAHHLVVDTVSWHVIVDDLRTACAQLAANQPIALTAPTASFQQWTSGLEAYVWSGALDQEYAYWHGVGRAMPRSLAAEESNGANTIASAETIVECLPAADTMRLLRNARAMGLVQPIELLLTATAVALGRWTGLERIGVMLEGHGREALWDVDVSRTVGWFTSFYPVVLETVGEPSRLLGRIKEQWHSVPRRGIGYGLLRYMSPDPEIRASLAAAPLPSIAFNYLGQLEGARGDSPVSVAAVGAGGASGDRSWLLKIDVGIRDGALFGSWTYSTNLYRRETIASVAREFRDVLGTLVAAPVTARPVTSSMDARR